MADQAETPQPDAPADAVQESETPVSETDLAAELEKWKAHARKNEDRAKANAAAAKELESVRRQAMTDQEKAVADAVAAAKAEVFTEVASRLVDAEVRAAAAGRNVDVDALLDGLDRRKFVGDDNEVDRDAVATWIDRIAPDRGTEATVIDIGQGPRGAQPPALNSDALEQALRLKVGADSNS